MKQASALTLVQRLMPTIGLTALCRLSMKARRMLLRTVIAGLALLVVTSLAEAQVVPIYGAVERADLQHASDAFKRVQLLEQVSDGLNRTLRLPTRIFLTAHECGEVNAFYRPGDRSVHLCYELLDQIMAGLWRDFGSAPTDDKLNAAFGAVFFFVDHEMGHALIDVLRLPVLGREEDAADMIATYFALRSREPYFPVLGTLWFFEHGKQEFSLRDFADEHSLGPQRKYNLLCAAVGKDKALFAPLAERLFLPPERADRCPIEYQKLEASVRQLIGRYCR